MRQIALACLMLAGTVQANSGLTVEQDLPDGKSYTAYLVSYRSDGLKVHAMVAVPKAARPQNGFPVLVANHGYVPEPEKYGIGADGVNARPGDYYRPVPELYASRGFLVVVPDYRGHNSSEGYAQIKGRGKANMPTIVQMYADDVIALLSYLQDIDNIDTERVFMWSHSMGGSVAIRALLATDIVKASSFWATTDVSEFRDQLSKLGGPVILQHATADKTTPYSNSVELAAELRSIAHPVTLRAYNSDSHFFDSPLREQAAESDTAFFRRAVTP